MAFGAVNCGSVV